MSRIVEQLGVVPSLTAAYGIDWHELLVLHHVIVENNRIARNYIYLRVVQVDVLGLVRLRIAYHPLASNSGPMLAERRPLREVRPLAIVAGIGPPSLPGCNEGLCQGRLHGKPADIVNDVKNISVQ